MHIVSNFFITPKDTKKTTSFHLPPAALIHHPHRQPHSSTPLPAASPPAAAFAAKCHCRAFYVPTRQGFREKDRYLLPRRQAEWRTGTICRKCGQPSVHPSVRPSIRPYVQPTIHQRHHRHPSPHCHPFFPTDIHPIIVILFPHHRHLSPSQPSFFPHRHPPHHCHPFPTTDIYLHHSRPFPHRPHLRQNATTGRSTCRRGKVSVKKAVICCRVGKQNGVQGRFAANAANRPYIHPYVHPFVRTSNRPFISDTTDIHPLTAILFSPPTSTPSLSSFSPTTDIYLHHSRPFFPTDIHPITVILSPPPISISTTAVLSPTGRICGKMPLQGVLRADAARFP